MVWGLLACSVTTIPLVLWFLAPHWLPTTPQLLPTVIHPEGYQGSVISAWNVGEYGPYRARPNNITVIVVKVDGEKKA